MSGVWRLAFALALLPIGCAHQSGALAPVGTARPMGAAGSGAVAGVAPAPAPAPAESSEVDEAAPSVSVPDPLSGWNRAMFAFNDKFYFWLVKPVSSGYRAVVPTIARTGVDNFFHNLATPVRVVSDLLQLKGQQAGIEVGRFMINSTWGVLGIGDWFADNPKARSVDTDLGLALAQNGVGGGAYVVWPILGPSTMRDSVGLVGGLFLDPVAYMNSLEAALATWGFKYTNTTSFRIGDYESLKNAAIDPYLAARDAYLQNRARRAKE
jgi:phospholipid-binding lipoprotein MlaA